ncbi:MAG: hypothetical protein CBC13_05795 [Planctomycetia bacterium TMED53]|nr:MAG: hypothetical protein CBC13_05795 [Planctomycetia bacterium TMED53]
MPSQGFLRFLPIPCCGEWAIDDLCGNRFLTKSDLDRDPGDFGNDGLSFVCQTDDGLFSQEIPEKIPKLRERMIRRCLQWDDRDHDYLPG